MQIVVAWMNPREECPGAASSPKFLLINDGQDSVWFPLPPLLKFKLGGAKHPLFLAELVEKGLVREATGK
jgi:hypothetical protein